MVPLVKRRMTGQIAGMAGAFGNVALLGAIMGLAAFAVYRIILAVLLAAVFYL